MKSQSTFRKFIALMLAVMLLTMTMTGCGKKGDEADPGNSESESSGTTEDPESTPYVPDDLNAAGGFDEEDPSQTPEPTETQQPEETEPPEETPQVITHTERYGGIPTENIIVFAKWFSEQENAVVSKNHTKERTEAILAEMKELNDKTDEQLIRWLDANIIGAKESDYAGVDQETIDDARNMAIVLMAAKIKYIPDIEETNEFLTPEGVAIMERWQAKLLEQNDGDASKVPTVENPTAGSTTGGNGGNGGGSDPNPTTTPGSNETGPASGGEDFGTKDSAVYTNASTSDYRDGIQVDFVINVPELAGTNEYPSVVILIYNTDGTVRTYATCNSSHIQGGTDLATGKYVYRSQISTNYSAATVRGYVYLRYIPRDEFVEDFMQIPMSDCVRIF